MPCKTRLEEMRQSVREADVGQASRKKVCLFVVGFFLSVCLFYLFGWETSRRKGFFLLHNLDSGYISSPQVARRTSSLARRHQRGFQIQRLLKMKNLADFDKFDDNVDQEPTRCTQKQRREVGKSCVLAFRWPIKCLYQSKINNKNSLPITNH